MPFTATDAKNKFGDILLEAQSKPVFIEKHAKTVAVVMSPRTFQSYEEAVAILKQYVARENSRKTRKSPIG